MKFNKQCPICLQDFEANDDIGISNHVFYHNICLQKKDAEKEFEIIDALQKVISNINEIEDYAFGIDLEELVGCIEEIKEYKYFIILRTECCGFIAIYTNDDNLEDLKEYLADADSDGRVCNVIGVIKNQKFVLWEDIPRTIQIKEDL